MSIFPDTDPPVATRRGASPGDAGEGVRVGDTGTASEEEKRAARRKGQAAGDSKMRDVSASKSERPIRLVEAQPRDVQSHASKMTQAKKARKVEVIPTPLTDFGGETEGRHLPSRSFLITISNLVFFAAGPDDGGKIEQFFTILFLVSCKQ